MCLHIEAEKLCENLFTTQTLLVFSSSLSKNGCAETRWAYLMSMLEGREGEQLNYFVLICIKIATLAFSEEPGSKFRQLILLYNQILEIVQFYWIRILKLVLGSAEHTSGNKHN